jgi:hypothetical protein
MAGKFSSHVRSNVVGYIAVFIALSGTAWAATELDKNDVKSKHIKNRGVKTKDLANNAVTSPKVADGSLLNQDFAAGQLPAGPQGGRGPQGEQGVPGEDATNLFAYVRDEGDAAAENAVIQYGSGVTGVEEVASTQGEYRVTFDRSLDNCVVSALAGTGEPQGPATSASPAAARVDIASADSHRVDLFWFHPLDSAFDVDTSFMIAAFC